MIKSARQPSYSLISSLNQSKDSSCQHQKKYRCVCCKDKKYHDYNRQKRIHRQSTSTKRILAKSQSQNIQILKLKKPFIPKTNLISNIQNYQIVQSEKQSQKKLPAIIQSPHLIKQQQKKCNSSGKKTPKIDMKSYCKSLFSSNKNKQVQNSIEVKLKGQSYFINFDSDEKMKLAIGQLKLLIHKMEKQDNNLITN